MAEPLHNHVAGCRAVWFDESGSYRGTRAFDTEHCETCRKEKAAMEAES